MSWFVTYVRSSIGAKQVMAITGLLLVLFAIVHMLGHFGMFRGPDAYNTYAHTLQSMLVIKWGVRGGLLAIFIIHVACALRLAAMNAAARPVKYAVYRTRKTNLMARTMVITGVAIFVFIGFHIIHFTLGMVQPEHFHMVEVVNGEPRYDAYSMFVYGFQQPVFYGIYLVSIALLSSHLGHGASSWLQSLGIRHPKYNAAIDKLGPVISLILFLGYMAPPTAVLLGIIKLPGA
jgi:succinate dehydrogenase / fumarate reductase cytochrome b subunit